MNTLTTLTAMPTRALKLEALSNISVSFELFCLASGMEALGEMMDHDTQAICGPHHARGHFRRAHRWGKRRARLASTAARLRSSGQDFAASTGKELAVPSWEAAIAEDWLGKWSMNQMLINVATRKFARSVRLPRATFRHLGGRSIEIGRFPPLRGAVCGAHEGVAVRNGCPPLWQPPDATFYFELLKP